LANNPDERRSMSAAARATARPGAAHRAAELLIGYGIQRQS
jgi:hypothetical protein